MSVYSHNLIADNIKKKQTEIQFSSSGPLGKHIFYFFLLCGLFYR